MKKTNTNKRTLTKELVRIALILSFVLTQLSTSVTPVLADTLSKTVSATVSGDKYTIYIEQGTAQLTVGSKAMFLTKENVADTAGIDKYGTAWVITYSGRCIGYNYQLQKDEPGIAVHTYVKNACKFMFAGEYVSSIETTTGPVELPDLEGFKKIAGISSNNAGNTSNNTGNTSNNTINNGSNNTGNTSNNTTNNGSNNTGNTSNNTTNNGNTSNTTNNVTNKTSVITKKTASGKTVTIIVTNGVGQVLVDNKLTNLPDKNICDIDSDANGTIIYILSDKNAKWFNPFLQMTESKQLASNSICLVKDSNDYVTGVVANSTIVKVLTIEEQKKELGIAETPTVVKTDESRVVKKGDYTYVVYKSDGKQLTKFTFKKGVVNWRGVKYNKIKRVGIIKKSKNMILTTSKGSVIIVNYTSMAKKTVFKVGKVKAKSYTYDSKGFVTGFITSDGIRHSVKSK